MKPTFDLAEGNWTTAATIRGLENEWQDAIRAHDVAAIDALLADDFTATSLTGREGGKGTMLGEIRNDKNVYDSARASRMSVRTVGPQAAVVTGIATEAGTTPEGRPFKTSRRFTDRWELRGDRWQCVASKVSALPDQ